MMYNHVHKLNFNEKVAILLSSNCFIIIMQSIKMNLLKYNRIWFAGECENKYLKSNNINVLSKRSKH
jgi:hypothetical protein